MVSIVGTTEVKAHKAAQWAASRSAPSYWCDLSEIYWQLATPMGIRPDVAFAQACKETGFGRFGGVINATYKNPCGLKTKTGGSNSDPNAHSKFPTWPVGIMAHLDHLALYAGAVGYPKEITYDPRHFAFIAGKAPTVEELGGKWAPNVDYGHSILRDYLVPMETWSK